MPTLASFGPPEQPLSPDQLSWLQGLIQRDRSRLARAIASLEIASLPSQTRQPISLFNQLEVLHTASLPGPLIDATMRHAIVFAAIRDIYPSLTTDGIVDPDRFAVCKASVLEWAHNLQTWLHSISW